jgi:hypothetical protein
MATAPYSSAPSTYTEIRTAEPPDYECLDTEQVPTLLRDKALREGNSPVSLAVYLLLGVYVGVLLTQSEVVSWYRIQEMFRFQSFHMYGIIGSAVAVAGGSLSLIKRLGLTTVHGEPIRLEPKQWGAARIPGARYVVGGSIFGMGWALLGACPGPIFALAGTGITVMFAALASAMLGTWAYSMLRPRLPH